MLVMGNGPPPSGSLLSTTSHASTTACRTPPFPASTQLSRHLPSPLSRENHRKPLLFRAAVGRLRHCLEPPPSSSAPVSSSPACDDVSPTGSSSGGLPPIRTAAGGPESGSTGHEQRPVGPTQLNLRPGAVYLGPFQRLIRTVVDRLDIA
ncbi:hypothetical protein Droror1_Dr00023535 [Drosera rotundifolia]